MSAADNVPAPFTGPRCVLPTVDQLRRIRELSDKTATGCLAHVKMLHAGGFINPEKMLYLADLLRELSELLVSCDTEPVVVQ